MLTLQDKIGWFAIYSRIIIISFSAFFNFIIPDHNAGVFLSPRDPLMTQSFADDIVSLLFGGLVRWDAQYFIHIASYGYTYENCLAFFPLFPMSVRYVARMLHYPLQGLISQYSVIVLSAVLINVVCFTLSARALYALGLKVLQNKEVAYKAALLFCVNPASIFFSAPYSETMFAYLTFYGMLKCENNRLIDSGILFGLAAATRSNGLLNIGFIFYKQFQEVCRLALPNLFSVSRNKTNLHSISIWTLIRSLLLLSIAILISLAPFYAFQAYGYYKFCLANSHNLPDFIIVQAKNNGFLVPGANIGIQTNEHWCNATLPLAYSYVQSHYWNVGFLRYYEWKQIPNFLLALPIALIVISQSVKFVRLYPQYCLRLGLVSSPIQHVFKESKELKYPPSMFVYIVHVVFLVVFCFLCIHVQVTTRLIASASPVIYWFVAYLFVNDNIGSRSNFTEVARQFQKFAHSSEQLDGHIESAQNLLSGWRVNIFTHIPPKKPAKIHLYYFILYFMLGTVMFSNFLPWT